MSPRGRLLRPRLNVATGSKLAAACYGLAILAASGRASATLADDARRLVEVWTPLGRVEQLRPRLASRGDILPVPLPSWATNTQAQGCTSVVFIASPSISFAVQVMRGGETEPRASQVGWAQLTRCGARRNELRSVLIEMRSPRGVLETLVAGASAPLPSVAQALAHRDPGPRSRAGDAGRAPVPPPLESRALAWEAQAKRDGATDIERRLLSASTGEGPLARMELGEGCHRFSALGLSTEAGDPPRDLDLFLRGEAAPDLARQDQSENSDAEITLCVGAVAPVKLGVLGLASAEPALLQHARFPLPRGLPERWGSSVRARFGDAFFRRRFSSQRNEPIYESLGIAGRTTLPLELELETCYVAAASVIQGNAKAFSLEATPSDREASTDGANTDDAAVVVAFCTGDDGFARLRIEANGASVAWLAALWRIGRQAPEESVP